MLRIYVLACLAALAAFPGASPGNSVSSAAQEPPDSLAALISAAGDSSTYSGADVVGVFDRTDVRVEKTGLGHVRRCFLTKVLTEEGARTLSLQRFDYDPASSFIRVDAVRVHRSEGAVENVSLDSLVDLVAPGEGIYWGARMKLLSLPRLRVGDAVEVQTYKKGFQIAYLGEKQGGTEAPGGSRAGADSADERYIPPMRGHFYDVVTFQDTYPLKEKSYRLTTSRGKPVQFAVYNGPLRSSLVFSDSLLTYEWRTEDAPALPEEKLLPEITDIAPKVVLATVENWPEKSRWFFAVNDSVFKSDEGIRNKVAELTRGLKSDDERMAVLLHWVAQEIRYSGLSMGKGEGYTLHPGIMTFEDRCGVCKDIAGMLVTMLRAAGYTTNPVMTMAGARVEAIPADQFNHCVVAVERKDGTTTMLDPTWAPFDRATWSRYEGEQHFVIGSPKGEGLSQMRTFKPEESRLTAEGVSILDEKGGLRGEMTFSAVGASGARLRGIVADAPARDRALLMANLLSSLGNQVEIGEVQVTDPRDFSRDARIHLRYFVPGYAAVGDSVLAVAPPLLRVLSMNATFTRLLAMTKEEEERKSEALMWFSQEVCGRESMALPKAFRREGRADTVRIERDAGSVKGRCLEDGGGIRTELTAVLAKRTVPAKEWAGGVEAADSLRAFGTRLRWARRGR